MWISLRFLLFFGLFLATVVNSAGQNFNDIAIANEYYKSSDFDKARILYEDLAKDPANIPLIHNNYYNMLLNLGAFDEAENYIVKLTRRFPNDLMYKVDQGRLYCRKNDKQKETQYFTQLINDYKRDPNRIRILAQFMFSGQLPEYAIMAYKAGRKESSDPLLFSLELANAYRYTNNKQMMIDEYINFAQQNPGNIAYVQNVLQSSLTEPDDLLKFESYLIEKVQTSPDNRIFNELLIWTYIQQKNFYGAFIQARAVDKRLKYSGSLLLDVGLISLENQDYENAIRIFQYIVKEYPKTINYGISKSLIIKSREELIKHTYPVDLNEIRKLALDYEQLVEELGLNNHSVEALRSKALLHAFYLDEFDTAIQILEDLVKINGVNSMFKAKCKLDLGDIYLFIDQPWESTLLYSQVEKSHKETTIGYEAKLKNAKLNFYKGEFALAQEHLDILKEATSREIANDAMAMSLLIQDNSVMDTTGAALRDYASIELMLFRNKKNEAIDSLTRMLWQYEGHRIIDEVLLLRAKTYIELGKFSEAANDLERIVKSYGFDINGDDAYYQLGKLYEEHMSDREKAMEIYQDFLKKYPGSLYVADVRNSFRKLRGDFTNVN